MLYANPSGARLSLDVIRGGASSNWQLIFSRNGLGAKPGCLRGGKVPLPNLGVDDSKAKPYLSGRFPLPLTKKADTRGRVDNGDCWCVKSYIAMMPLS